MKFGRGYRLTIDLGDGSDPIIIGLPLTIQFTINRKVSSNLNSCNLSIYNLSQKVRDSIFQEFFGTERRKTIRLEAGYDTLSTVFFGEIFEAYSQREGTNIITNIESRSGRFEIPQKNVFTTLNKGQTIRDILIFLCGRYETLKIGAVGDFPQQINHPVVLNGNVWDLLKEYSNNNVFVDNDKIYVLKREDVVEGSLPIINKDTGILSTPRRSGGILSVTTLFEPRVALSQKIDLESSIEPIYNGQYKVLDIQHTGTISEAVGGKCQTMLGLFVGSQSFQAVAE